MKSAIRLSIFSDTPLAPGQSTLMLSVHLPGGRYCTPDAFQNPTFVVARACSNAGACKPGDASDRDAGELALYFVDQGLVCHYRKHRDRAAVPARVGAYCLLQDFTAPLGPLSCLASAHVMVRFPSTNPHQQTGIAAVSLVFASSPVSSQNG